MKAYVYIASCADGSLYTGWTNDLTAREKAHNEGRGAKYTRSRLPVKIVYSEEFEDKNSAMRREVEIKNMSRSDKLKLF